MSDVQFTDENTLSNSFRSRTVFGDPTSPKMITLVLKTGIVKTDKQAANVLFLITGICFLLSIFIFYAYVFGGLHLKNKMSPEEERSRQEFFKTFEQVGSMVPNDLQQ
jgi:hypothetical protein